MQRFEGILTTVADPSWTHTAFLILKWVDHHVARPFGWVAMLVLIIAIFRGRRWLVRLVIRWTGRVLKLRRHAETQLAHIQSELFPSDVVHGADAWVSPPSDYFTNQGGDQKQK